MNLLKTIIPNQLAYNGNFENGITGWISTNADYISILSYNGRCKCTQKVASTLFYRGGIQSEQGSHPIPIVSGHKYFCSAICNLPFATSVMFALKTEYMYHSAETTQYTTPNIDQSLSAIVTATQNGNSYSVWPNPTPFSVGTVYYIDDVVCIDLTLLYGAGNEPTTVAEFKQKFPLSYYPYSTTNTTGIMTNVGGAVTCDVGQMLPEGIGVVDLGELNWIYYPDKTTTFYAYINGKSTEWGSVICDMYTTTPNTAVVNLSNMCMRDVQGYTVVYIRNDNYSTTESFKSAMSGQLLFYKKATT